MSRTAAAGLVLLVVVSGACALPDDDDPRAIAPRDVESLTPTTAAVDQSQGDEVVDVYFLNERTDRLMARERMVEETSPRSRLEALFEAPTADRGDPPFVTSVIPTGTVVVDATLDDVGVLTVDLGSSTVLPQADAAVQMFAQMVFTVTEDERVIGVRFSIDGQAFDVPVDNGPNKPTVAREDYSSLDPDAGG